MIPGMNNRQMKQAMKRMGVQQEEIPASQVIIKLEDKQIVLDNPSVQKVNMMGQSSYQISGEEKHEEYDNTPEISEEDIETVMEQAGVSKEEALKALEENEGDLAQAIVSLSEK